MIKKFFGRKKKDKVVYSNKNGIGYIMYENDHVTIVHDACRICYNKKVDNTYEEKLKYIASKVKLGHESILEHSNVIIKLELTKELYPELATVLSHCRYLNTKVKEVDGMISVLIGGSIRGYKHIIRNIDEATNNKVFSIIFQLMYELPYCYFEDLIEDEIFNRFKFKNIDTKVRAELDGEEIVRQLRYAGTKIERKKFNIVGMDDVTYVYNQLSEKEKLAFTIDDILDLTSITILFKEVSRPISQQLVRHRAGITQLSQRYVNMEDGKFLSPDMFKPEEYDKDKKYNINLTIDNDTKEGVGFFKTLQELGVLMNTVYPQLVIQGLKKEDARAYLLNNTETSLYMTFTTKNFIKFLQLRTEKAAQAEIRLIALELEAIFKERMKDSIGEDIYAYILPKYTRISLELDAVADEELEEVLEVTTEEVITNKEELENDNANRND